LSTVDGMAYDLTDLELCLQVVDRGRITQGASARTCRWHRPAAVQAFFAEFVGTFILVFTVFGVIHRKASVGFAGVAIGLVVFAAIIPVAPTTGASINPARTFGPMLVQQIAGGSVAWSQLPVYLAAECLAGVLAAFAYVAISKTRADDTPSPLVVPAEATTAA
jgi:glycerol uptake facilitator protein